MKTTTEVITPEIASRMLNANQTNREMRSGVAEKYAADMAADNWTECVVPISFYEDGDLADGQHRLYAIIESGTTQTFIIVRGLKRKSGLNIDIGLNRTLVDNARISGTDSGLSNQVVAYARAIEDGDGSSTRNPRTHAEQLVLVNRHRDAAEWIVHNGPRGRGIRNAVTMAAMGRAWYIEQDKERLKRFADVLSTGFSDGANESAAVSMRNFLIARLSEGATVTTGGNWRPTFLKVQNAIRYFMLKKPLMQVRVITDETYPLAGAKLKARQLPTTEAGRRAHAKVARKAKQETRSNV